MRQPSLIRKIPKLPYFDWACYSKLGGTRCNVLSLWTCWDSITSGNTRCHVPRKRALACGRWKRNLPAPTARASNSSFREGGSLARGMEPRTTPGPMCSLHQERLHGRQTHRSFALPLLRRDFTSGHLQGRSRRCFEGKEIVTKCNHVLFASLQIHSRVNGTALT